MTTETTRRSVLDDIHDFTAFRQELALQAHLFKAEAKDKIGDLEERWRALQRTLRELKDKPKRAVRTALRDLVQN